jgi:hypothetical protein
MTANKNDRCVGLGLGVAFVALLVFPVMKYGQGVNSAAAPKLATPLADVVRNFPQERGAVTKRATAQPGFSVESLPKSARDAIRTGMMRINGRAEVQVYILVTELSDDNIKQLEAAGVTVELKEEARRLVQAEVPLARLAQVSELPFVTFVHFPIYSRRHTGSVTTEGDTILRADQVRSQFHVDGTGTFVAAISDGLKGVFASSCTTCSGATGGPISTNDLPDATGTRNASGILTASSGGIVGQSFDAKFSDLEGLPRDASGNVITTCGFPGAGAEGTALLEIIHDIAPGAKLSFANFTTDVEFNKAVNALAVNNDVVVDDIGFFGSPFDGTSVVSSNTASALNNNANIIRTYVTAVGNEADGHYLEAYHDSGSYLTVNGVSGNMHLFQATSNTTDTLNLGQQAYNEIELKPNGEAVLFLSWDDPFGSSPSTPNKYNLYLFQHGTNTVVASDVGQTCEGPTNPVACLSYVNPNAGPANAFFDIVIQNPNNASAVKNLNLFAFTPECAVAGLVTLVPITSHAKVNFNTIASSIIAEGDAGGSPVSVISVGAVCSATAKSQAAFGGHNESCNDTTGYTIEFFSSRGPTLDGRTKPDITGIDGVSVTGAGSFENPFFGTSAAAPHIAGIAALLLQSAPCLLSGQPGAADSVTARTKLRNLLLDGTGNTVPDNTFGFGVANALASASGTLPSFTGPATITVSGNSPTGASITPAQVGFTDPNACPLTALQWTGGCGSGGPAASMPCGFGANNVTVSASNNNVTYPPLAPLQVVVTDFGVGVAPGSATVTAGQSATYVVTASAQGGAYSSAITLACSGLPSLANCTFNPPTVTPGATSTTSTLTITTTAHAMAPPGNGAPPNGMLRQLRTRPFAVQPRGLPVLWIVLAASVILGWLGTRRAPFAARRRLAAWGTASILAAFFALQMACGGGGGGTPPPSGGTPPGTYTISLSGTAGTLVHTGTATLVVQ